jgi:Carboxypeptidase regulatory-like domain
MDVHRHGSVLGLTALALVLACGSAWAQATATISGTARDQSGAVLPGVTITVTQQETSLVRTTVTNETGSYVLPNLPLGPYRLEAMLQGFATFAQGGIVLQVNASPVVNPVMGVSAIAEEVQVTGAAPLVDTRSTGVGTVVELQRVVELPLNARQTAQLITLSGLAVQTASSPAFSMNTGVRISVAGGNDYGVSYSLDGAPHLNNFDGTGMHLPFPAALQEFRIATGAQEAGGTIRAGASVSAVTKSGTNAFHGEAFEFARDSRFNAGDFLSGRKDGLKRNQFGGLIGGPIVRDKVFFFAGLQTTTTRQNPLDQVAFVPTAAMLTGDFTAFASAACNGGRAIALGAPFVGNRIDASLLSPAALNISRRLPTPIDECGKAFWGAPVHENEAQIPIRVDFQKSPAHSFIVRYMLTTDDRTIPYDAADNNALVTNLPGSDDRAHNLTVGHTWVINSKMVNSFRVLGNDIYANKPGPKFFGAPDVGINAYTYVPGYIRLIVNNAFSLGSGSFNSNTYTKVRNAGVNDDFTVVKGSHQFGFGGHYLWTKSDSVANAWSVGGYTFTGQFTGNAMGDFFTGRIAQHRQANPNPVRVTQPVSAAYAQDTWKLNRVTLSYGVVWNPFLPMNFYEADVYNFSLDAFNKGTRSTVMKNAPPGFSYPGDPGFEGNSGVKSHYKEFDPRVGFAWDVSGDGRTAIRAGAGLGHDYVHQYVHLNTSSVAPFRLTVNLPPGASLDNPWAGYPGGNVFPYEFNPANPSFPVYSSFLPLPSDLKPTEQYSWDAGVQRQLTRRWFASATYLGTKIVNMLNAEEMNPALNLGFGPCTLYDATIGANRDYPVCTTAANRDQRRLLNLQNRSVALGYVTQYSDVGYQNYNGMLLNTRFDVGTNVNINANYTLSKCVGLSPIGAVLNVGANHTHQPYQNNGPTDKKLDEGPCAADRRHLFNLTSVLRTPEFNGVLGVIASHWTAASVLQVRSGAPVNVIAGGDPAFNGFTDNAPTQRPNVVPGVNPYGDRSGLTGYYNPAAFSQPAPGTLGDAPYNMLLGPGFWQWDQSFVRGFNLGTGNRIELRAEAINLTNHFNKGNPSATLNNLATFGRITSTATNAAPRIWQFAVKYVF